MWTHRHLRVVVALILGIGVGALGIAEASARPRSAPVDESILETFAELEAHVSQLPGGELKKRDRGNLTRKLEKSERAYRRGRACTAASLLGRYLNQTRLLMKRKRNPVPVAEDLRNRG